MQVTFSSSVFIEYTALCFSVHKMVNRTKISKRYYQFYWNYGINLILLSEYSFLKLIVCVYTVQILAAHRYGIKRVILPERNLKDLVEVPSAVFANMEVTSFMAKVFP